MFETEQSKSLGSLIIISKVNKDSDYFSKCKIRNVCKNAEFVVSYPLQLMYFEPNFEIVFKNTLRNLSTQYFE